MENVVDVENLPNCSESARYSRLVTNARKLPNEPNLGTFDRNPLTVPGSRKAVGHADRKLFHPGRHVSPALGNAPNEARGRTNRKSEIATNEPTGHRIENRKARRTNPMDARSNVEYSMTETDHSGGRRAFCETKPISFERIAGLGVTPRIRSPKLALDVLGAGNRQSEPTAIEGYLKREKRTQWPCDPRAIARPTESRTFMTIGGRSRPLTDSRNIGGMAPSLREKRQKAPECATPRRYAPESHNQDQQCFVFTHASFMSECALRTQLVALNRQSR